MGGEKKVPTHYRWHWQDFRLSRKVQRMNYIERGLFRELLDEQWAEGSIPVDINLLAEVAGCPVQIMVQAWERVLSACFERRGNVYINRRLAAERERHVNFCEGRRTSANKRWSRKNISEINDIDARALHVHCERISEIPAALPASSPSNKQGISHRIPRKSTPDLLSRSEAFERKWSDWLENVKICKEHYQGDPSGRYKPEAGQKQLAWQYWQRIIGSLQGGLPVTEAELEECCDLYWAKVQGVWMPKKMNNWLGPEANTWANELEEARLNLMENPA